MPWTMHACTALGGFGTLAQVFPAHQDRDGKQSKSGQVQQLECDQIWYSHPTICTIQGTDSACLPSPRCPFRGQGLTYSVCIPSRRVTKKVRAAYVLIQIPYRSTSFGYHDWCWDEIYRIRNEIRSKIRTFSFCSTIKTIIGKNTVF